MATLPTTMRDDAPAFSGDPAQSGTVFSDATRLLDNAGTASGPVAQSGGNISGQENLCHDIRQEAGERGGRPVPSFWNFAENKPSDDGDHHRFELRRHHA